MKLKDLKWLGEWPHKYTIWGDLVLVIEKMRDQWRDCDFYLWSMHTPTGLWNSPMEYEEQEALEEVFEAAEEYLKKRSK